MKTRYTQLFVILIFAGSLLGTGLVGFHQGPAGSSQTEGRNIYISEGCIHCHSQYSRNGTIDTEMWGPASGLPRETGGTVLIGNRRQGPDLSNVGLRRSREWNRAHLISPGALSPGSRMPEYGHLFEKGRSTMGESLLDYLESLVPENRDSWWTQVYAWCPSVDFSQGDIERGEASYRQNCQQCHGESGRGDGPVASLLQQKPRDLVDAKFKYAPDTLEPGMREKRLAQIIKYGQSGTSMPGHECLTDVEIVDLLAFLHSLKANTEQE